MARNGEVADFLDEIGDLMEIDGESFFRTRAFRRAAESLRNLAEDIATVAGEGRLETLDGVGKSIAADIVEYLESGTCKAMQSFRVKYPSSLTDLLRVPNLGPKKVALVFHELGVTNLDELEAAIAADRLSTLAGMGAKSQEKIAQGIATLRKTAGRSLLDAATAAAEAVIAELQPLPQVLEISYAGSLRRQRETIGDIDILVATREAQPVMDRFVSLGIAAEIQAHGDTKSSIRTAQGLQIDLRAVEPESYGAAQQYFTGSKDHNIRVRERAIKLGMKINEYGVFREEDGTKLAGESEAGVYAALGLQWIPPELRESRGEIDAAEKDELPRLIELADLRSELHCHTTWSDGHASITAMAEAAKARGYSHIVITDHSKALAMANGLDEKRLMEQIAAVRAADAEVDGIRILAGNEVDILGEGELDLDGEVLDKLDIVVGSVHSRFNLPADEMTERICNAMRTGLIDLVGHPTGRLIGQREPYELHLDKLIETAAATGTILEINAFPQRLDLNDVMARTARQRGVLLAVNTDAHSVDNFDFARYGVATARRAWLTADGVVNTWGCDRLLAHVAARGSGSA